MDTLDGLHTDTITLMAARRCTLSPEAAARYEQRWTAVHERLTKELRATPIETKLLRLEALMESGKEMGWSRSSDDEDDRVWRIWMELRRKMHGPS